MSNKVKQNSQNSLHNSLTHFATNSNTSEIMKDIKIFSTIYIQQQLTIVRGCFPLFYSLSSPPCIWDNISKVITQRTQPSSIHLCTHVNTFVQRCSYTGKKVRQLSNFRRATCNSQTFRFQLGEDFSSRVTGNGKEVPCVPSSVAYT